MASHLICDFKHLATYFATHEKKIKIKISLFLFCLLYFLIFHLFIYAHKTLHQLISASCPTKQISILPWERNPISQTVQIHTLHILCMCVASMCPIWHAENWNSEALQHFSHNTQGISGKGGGKKSSFPNSHCFPCKVIIEVIWPGKLKMPIKGILDIYWLYDTDMFEMFCLVFLHNCRIQSSFSKRFYFQ